MMGNSLNRIASLHDALKLEVYTQILLLLQIIKIILSWK